MSEGLRVEALGERNLTAWTALFAACRSTCFCRFWDFEGDNNAWLARCMNEPDANEREQCVAIRAGSLQGRGLLALKGDQAVGWIKTAPRSTLAKLRRRGPYRSLDLGADDGVWSIACLLVHPTERRAGVARTLVAAAEGAVRGWGGRVVEAYPHRAGHPLHDEEAWMGPERLFVSLGYVAFHDGAPYPIYRKPVAGHPLGGRAHE
ncbi:MAG: GNAT family N-acetyltransferase [Myxococcota bacterium]|nr:GNAT family N-acetyltransferase [Myxococcota bacterium]